MLIRSCQIALVCLALTFTAKSQTAEVSIGLNEPFFDVLLESVFKNFDPPQFSIARSYPQPVPETLGTMSSSRMFSYFRSFVHRSDSSDPSFSDNSCDQAIKLLKEMNGVNSAIRFREGKIYVPLAFSGNYSAPLVGCVEFSGWAETNVDLEFDSAGQKLIGKVRVLNVHLNGARGLGGTVIARLLQNSIDQRFNPVELVSLEKLSFGVPISNKGNLHLRAVGARTEIMNGYINIRLLYQFNKS